MLYPAHHRELPHAMSGIVLRLLGMASDRLRRALRAVPDDIKTRHALADAYQVRHFSSVRLSSILNVALLLHYLISPHHLSSQTEGAAHLQLISKVGLKHVVSVSRLRSVRSKLPPSPLTSPDLSLADIGTPKHDLTDLEPSERARIDLANTAFRRYAELQYSLSHTRCCKLRLSYRGEKKHTISITHTHTVKHT